MDHKGCQVILFIIAIGVLIGMVVGSAPMFNRSGQGEPGGEALFTAFGKDHTFADLQRRYETIAQQRSAVRGTPGGDAGLYGQSIIGLLNDAAVAQIAQERNVVMNEAAARAAADKMAVQEWEYARIQLITTGKIKPEASEQEADKALEKEIGKNKDQFKTEVVEYIMTNFKAEATAADTASQLLTVVLLDSYATGTIYTEADLKAAYDEFSFDTIRFDDATKSATELQAAAEKALADIRGGKKFEDVQKTYSVGKKPDELKATLIRGALEAAEHLSPLQALKPGEVSDVVTTGVPTIYRLVATKPNLPKDFEASKAQLLQSAKQQRAGQAFEKDVKAKVDAAEIKFQDLGTKALYDLMKIVLDTTKTDKSAEFEDLYNQIRGQDLTKVMRVDFLGYAELAAALGVWQGADATKRKEFAPDWIDTVERSFQYGEDLGMRIQLEDVQLEQGLNEDAASTLEQTMANCADYGQEGQGIYTRVSASMRAAFESKKFNQEQRDAIQKELDKWLDQKIEEDKRLAEEKAEQARIQKELDDEADKAAASKDSGKE